MKQNDLLIIIPARGGSKGIPRKNIKLLGGKPLIAWTIDVARKLAPDSRVILSTEDEEIASVTRSCGLPVDYMRPPELASDTAGSREVIIDVMDWADGRGLSYGKVVLLQPTSPFRTVQDVERALELYTDNCDMVVSVTEASSNPYYNCFETDSRGYLQVSKGSGLYTRRQDAPPAWEYNGAVYVINPESIRKMSLGEMPRRIPSLMPRERSVDLDTPIDWIVAEAIVDAAEKQKLN